MTTPNAQTPGPPKKPAPSAGTPGTTPLAWPIALAVVGVALVAVAIVLEIIAATQNTSNVVAKTGDVTTTTVKGAAPTAAVITTALGAGVILVLAGGFFSRINKLVITGVGELDLDNQARVAGALATAGMSQQAAQKIYAYAATRLPSALAAAQSEHGLLPITLDAVIAGVVADGKDLFAE